MTGAASSRNPLPHAPPAIGRRGFLKAAGFGLGGLATGCTPAPVNHAIPSLLKPEEVTPGRALRYASTCGGCEAGCGMLVKVRDGRPVKLEGNPAAPASPRRPLRRRPGRVAGPLR